MQARLSIDQASVVKNTALLLACVLLSGIGLRALLVRQIEPAASSIGAVSALLLLYVRLRLSRGAPTGSGALVVVAITLLTYAALSWTSNGFRGSIIFAAPMVPLIASLMLGKGGTRNVTIIIAAFLLFILSQHLTGGLQPEESFPEQIRYSLRAIILLLSLVGVGWIISYYAAVAGSEAVVAESGKGEDPLTGLLSREVMEQALQREFARARRAESQVSLALAEVDGFADLQEEYGMHAAENLLIGVADGLRYCMRRSSDALGRFGPQQLAILMPDTNSRGGHRVGEKFRQLIETLDIPIDESRTTTVTISVGVCTVQARGEAGPAMLIGQVEQALSTARARGGNVTEVHTGETGV
jgi:diguanylate cyclase (GGDEF)-like protein